MPNAINIKTQIISADLCPTLLPSRSAVVAQLGRFKAKFGDDANTISKSQANVTADNLSPSKLPYRVAVLTQIAALKLAKKE